ncbi:MAG: SBBP repeat-containing protein [Candidatus Sumerlaeota bacterium]|nr:SBBP repeat-containing protein [Candidatus Sumerlaeota bacterium]
MNESAGVMIPSERWLTKKRAWLPQAWAFLLAGFLTACAYGASPSLQFATLYGGDNYDRAQGCTVDKEGYIYIIGNTRSSNLKALGLTTAGAYHPEKYQTEAGWSEADAFVAKLSPDGSRVLWGTYLGGSREDRGYGVRVDSQGYVFAVGITGSPDFPATQGAFQTSLADRNSAKGHEEADVFIAKLTPDGSALVYATYVGGSDQDWSRGGMWIQPDGSLYVSGHSASANFPATPAAFQTTHAADKNPKDGAPLWDGVLFHLSADGRQLLHSTFLGGNGRDSLYSGVAVHSDGTVYAAGMTSSTNLPTTPGAFQPAYGGDSGSGGYIGDGIVARFSSDLSRLVYCTYLGGSDDDDVNGNQSLTVDSKGQAVVVLMTKSASFPTTPGAYSRSYSGGVALDGALSILSADGKALVASTFLGGAGPEELSALTLDSDGNVYVSGNTGSKDYPTTPDAVQKTHGGGNGQDAVLTVLTPDLSGLLYSTFYGGGGSGGYGDRGRSIFLEGDGSVVISGDTNSPDFPTTAGALQRKYGGGTADAFVIRLADLPVPGGPGAASRSAP